jgi:hypothetical protein
LEPDYALVSGGRSQLLVQIYSAGTDLQAALKLDGWSASPAERMERLCRASGCRLGLVTDGVRLCRAEIFSNFVFMRLDDENIRSNFQLNRRYLYRLLQHVPMLTNSC